MDELLVCILIICLIVYIQNDKRRKCQSDDNVEGIDQPTNPWLVFLMFLILWAVCTSGIYAWNYRKYRKSGKAEANLQARLEANLQARLESLIDG